MKKEIKFSLVFRDMWQSAGKYVPRVDQLVKVAPAIVEMGCFARVETNGGGFEQVNLLFGENPNKAVREWTKPFHEAGIQTHMLDRALKGLRLCRVAAVVRKLFYNVKKAQGTDITRTFCGLNDIRNIAPSITYAHEAGMISQCSLCITHSPIHTVEYYTDMALKLIKLGADEICIKHHTRRWHSGERVQLAGRPEGCGVYVLGHGVQQGIHAVIPQKTKPERFIITLGRCVADHADRTVLSAPLERGKRGREQFKRLDSVFQMGIADEKWSCPVGVERLHQISSNP